MIINNNIQENLNAEELEAILSELRKIKPKFKTMDATEKTYLESEIIKIRAFASFYSLNSYENLTMHQLLSHRKILVNFLQSEGIETIKDLLLNKQDAMLNSILKKIPLTMHALKVLHSLKKNELIDAVLDEYLNICDDQEKLAALIQRLNKKCEEECRTVAISELDKMIPDYSSLPQQYRNALEEQYSYIITLDSYSVYLRDNREAFESLRLHLQEASVLITSNIEKVAKNRFITNKALKELELSRQRLYAIATNQRVSDFYSKFVNSSLKLYSLFVPLNTALAVAPPLSALISSIIIPGVSGIKAGVESYREIFPELEQKRQLLERTDLDVVDKVFLYQQDLNFGYDPVTGGFIDNQEGLLIENNNVFEDIKTYVSKEVSNRMKMLKKVAKESVDENFLNEFHATRDLYNDLLVVAGKTLFGLMFITFSLLLTVLLSVGLSGPILLFAMSPALSVGLVAAIVAAGLKYMYPNPKDGSIGFIVEKAVELIFAPIKFASLAFNKLSNYIYNTFYTVKEKILQKTAPDVSKYDMNLPDDHELLEDFQVLNKDVPGLMPMLIEYFKLEQQSIKDKYILDPYKASQELDNIKIFWDVLKSKRNQPLNFVMVLGVFLQQRYELQRKNFEVIVTQRANIKSDTYIEPKHKYLSFKDKPNFAMPQIIDHSKDQQLLRDLSGLKSKVDAVKLKYL